MSTAVLSEVKNGVRTLTLNRPERLNAINAELIAGLQSALAEAEADAATRVLVLRGSGRAFCSGDDLRDFPLQARSEAVARDYITALQNVSRAMVHHPKPILAAVHGWAVGGGLEWAIDCDLVIMARGTRCFFPELGWGLPVPTGGVTNLLPRLVGLQRARAMLLFGEPFDADAALQMGLAWKVVPEPELFIFAQQTGERLAALPESPLREFKAVMNRAADLDFDGALALEAEATVRGFLDPATAQRIRRFTEPEGEGR